MSVSDFLHPFWVPVAFPWFGSHTLSGECRISAVLYEIALKDLARLSDRGMPQRPHHSGRHSVACCQTQNIGHFQPHNNFPAQSLHFRSGSVFPCPTLKSGVTASTPRTRYGRLVRPYPVRFSHPISSAYQCKQMWQSACKGKSVTLISQLAHDRYYTTNLTKVQEEVEHLFCLFSIRKGAFIYASKLT